MTVTQRTTSQLHSLKTDAGIRMANGGKTLVTYGVNRYRSAGIPISGRSRTVRVAPGRLKRGGSGVAVRSILVTRPARTAHFARVGRQPTCLGQCPAEHELHLRV